jgi:hypothetical protein
MEALKFSANLMAFLRAHGITIQTMGTLKRYHTYHAKCYPTQNIGKIDKIATGAL